MDEIEIISFENQKEPFPLHFHKEYCISLIRKGTEVIQIKDKKFIGHTNTITITHPYELHANPLFSLTNLLSFDTLYLNIETFKALAPNHQLVYFNNRIIQNKTIQQAFNQLTLIRNTQEKQQQLQKFLSLFISCSDHNNNYQPRLPLQNWDLLEKYVDTHIKDSFNLEALANELNINKFSLARKFKKTTGLSPIHYVLMKKIFHSKDRIVKGVSITDLAYDYNFTDIAHFSKLFKKFIGISPTKYRDHFTP